MFKVYRVLKDQRGMQTIEVIGLAIIGLIALSLLYNRTKGGLNSTSNKVGNTIKNFNNSINDNGIPDTINI